MHPVQEHTNRLGIDYSIQRLTEYILYMNMKGSVYQPRVLQLNLHVDNINWLPHSKYPDRKNRGICWCGNRTHDFLRARQMPKPLDHRLPTWIYYRGTVKMMYLWIMCMLGSRGGHYKHHTVGVHCKTETTRFGQTTHFKVAHNNGE